MKGSCGKTFMPDENILPVDTGARTPLKSTQSWGLANLRRLVWLEDRVEKYEVWILSK